MAQRRRTIQHPGFEFLETDSGSTYSYVQNSAALAVGYFSKGPVGTPVLINSIALLKAVYGEPETDAEYYSYKGVYNILNMGRSVTVVRFPYDNTMSPLGYNEDRKIYYNPYYKILRGKFNIAKESTDSYTDISAAYRNKVIFKTVDLTPDIVNYDYILQYNTNNDTEEDFIIVNKFNDYVTKSNEEYIVTVLGAGNAIRKQSLSADALGQIKEIEIFKTNSEGTPLVYIHDKNNELTYGKIRDSWETTGSSDINGQLNTICDEYFSNLSNYFPDIVSNEISIPTNIITVNNDGVNMQIERVSNENVGKSKRVISFYTALLPELIDNNSVLVKDLYVPESQINDATISYESLNASNTFVGDLISSWPQTKSVKDARIEIVNIADPDHYKTVSLNDNNIAYVQQVHSKYNLNYYDDAGNLIETYDIKLTQDSVDVNLPFKWTITLEAEYDKTTNYYVDKDKSNTIAIIVSKIKSSSLEIGHFTIEPVEMFSGSIFKGSINKLTNESDYIGDIINKHSSIISFYGKKEYDNYKKDTDVILVEKSVPYRFSLINNSKINLESTDVVNINKIVKSLDNEYIDMADVLDSLLVKVGNNMTYSYRDVYDFGLTSALTFLNRRDVQSNKSQLSTGYYYNTSVLNDMATISTEFNKHVATWKRIARKFLNHCQNRHKLSMAFIDGPRHFLLNGALSKVDDYKLDQNDSVITGKRAQMISIKDCTYGSINVQWWQVQNEYTHERIWVPNSLFQAQNITYNDIINNVWDAPAGYNYGKVQLVYRPACNPNFEAKDVLYLNCLNYGVAWSDGVNTIEGQKTTYGESTSLNRINVRRLMIYIEKYVHDVSIKYRYNSNTLGLRQQLYHELNVEFSRLKTKGALYNYRIVCDESNNTLEVIDNNELRLAIMVQPVKTAEFIVAQFVVTKTTSNINELYVS